MKGNTKSRMENREAIEKLERHSKLICHGCMHPSMVGWCENHCQLPEAFNMAIAALKKLEREDWIKCSERQPEESDLYLVTVDKDYFPENCSQVDFLYWDSEAKEWKFVYEEYKLEKFDAPVIAWKTRPEPYKERMMNGQELGHRNSG